MPRAVWNGQVVAESDDTILLEGNHYFPRDAIDVGFLRDSDTHTFCFWKGQASYYDVVADGETARDAAFYYPDPSPAARSIKGHVAFWRGVRVET